MPWILRVGPSKSWPNLTLKRTSAYKHPRLHWQTRRHDRGPLQSQLKFGTSVLELLTGTEAAAAAAGKLRPAGPGALTPTRSASGSLVPWDFAVPASGALQGQAGPASLPLWRRGHGFSAPAGAGDSDAGPRPRNPRRPAAPGPGAPIPVPG